MNFTVLWMPHALNELAAIWMNAEDRNTITAASYQIDQRLAENPWEESESRTGSERIAFNYPLRVLFRIFPSDRKVEVYSVGVFNRRT